MNPLNVTSLSSLSRCDEWMLVVECNWSLSVILLVGCLRLEGRNRE